MKPKLQVLARSIVRRFAKPAAWGACVRRAHADQTGATAVEYAVMLALIILACFASVILLGSNLNSSWTNTSNSIQTVTGS